MARDLGVQFNAMPTQQAGAKTTGEQGLSQAAGTLARSQGARDQMLARQATEAQQAADIAAKPSTIAKETFKGTVNQLLSGPVRAVKSALALPVDVARTAMGKGVDTSATTDFAGQPMQTYQGAVASGKPVLPEVGQAALDVASVLPVGKAASVAKPLLGKAGGLLSKAASPVTKPITSYLAGRAEKKAADFALDLATPKITKRVGEQGIEQGRMTAPGLFRGSKIVPSTKDKLVSESIQDVVSPKKDISQNIEAIRGKISTTNAGVKDAIREQKIPFNEGQLRSRLNAAKEENKLIFASDATAERTYNAVVDEFMGHVGKKDTLGLFEARQSFDKIPAIKKLLDTQSLGENVRRQIVLDVRRAANEYIADQLPAGSAYREVLRNESRMIEALGNIAEKNYTTIGKNKLQLLTEEYPILKWIVSGAVGGGAVGAGGAIIGSSN